MENKSRIDAIDFFRGLAVIVMIFANSTPYLFDLKDIFSIRFLFSAPAPIFIFLAGFTSQINFEKGKQISFYRIFQCLLMAILIDIVIWRSVPFYTFDVLYLIVSSKFLLLFIQKINKPKFIFLILILFISIYLFLINKFLFLKILIMYFEIVDIFSLSLNINPFMLLVTAPPIPPILLVIV